MAPDPIRPAPAAGSPPLRLLQGMAMGGADVIPGVSGGTVALILGIYATLIGAIGSVAGAVAALVRGRPGQARRRWAEVPWGFVLPLLAGIVLALGLGSAVLPPLLERYPAETSAVFFGMIAASLAVPWRDAGDRGPREVALAAAAAVAAFLVMGLPAAAAAGSPGLPRVFASAAVAICAMILPGVSGAFLLVVLGMYEPTLEALRSLDLPYVLTFVVGCAVGLGLFSKLLAHLLDRHLAVTMAALTGLMLGALRVLWPWGGADGRLDPPPGAGEALVVLAFAVGGFAVVRSLVALGDRAGHRHEVEEAGDILEEELLAEELLEPGPRDRPPRPTSG
jgi:putative membrane protein